MISMRLDGKAAIVTGGSRGIGRATCLALAALGASIVVHYNERETEANTVVDQIVADGGRAVAVQADLADINSGEALAQAAHDHFGRIDILVNNAAILTDSTIAEMEDDIWQRMIDINLSAVFRCIRASLPSMRAGSWGRIINLTSQAAWTGSLLHAHYAAAKSGLQGLTYSLAKEEGRHGITVNLVAPGRIRTDMLDNRGADKEAEWLKATPLGRFGTPDEVAAAIAFLAGDAASYITGATIHINGGMMMR